MSTPFVFDAASMSTGVSSVDAQHRQLFVIINDLVDAMERRKGADAVGRSLTSLTTYTRTHFTHEEKCMTAAACPVAKVNALQHEQFMRTVEGLTAKYNAARSKPEAHALLANLAAQVNSAVGQWLKMHILGTDINLNKCPAVQSGQVR